MADSKYNPQRLFELLLNTGQLEYKLKEVGDIWRRNQKLDLVEILT